MKKLIKLIFPEKLLRAIQDYRVYGRRLEELPNEKLMALMRHDAHRIEKTLYNDIFYEKYNLYKAKHSTILRIFGVLEGRGLSENEPTIAWARKICENFDDLNEKFIKPNSRPAPNLMPEKTREFVNVWSARRSVRVWADDQPAELELSDLSLQLIDAARWAPTSGNRQPWRFKVIMKPEHKILLRGLKEQHCISAPLLVFVGMDTRVYGALGNNERGIYLDAGAAITGMILAAHAAGYGTCWNHFSDDLVISRKSNVKAYDKFSKTLGIPNYVAPVAILAVGRAAFIPPVPARACVHSLLLPDPE